MVEPQQQLQHLDWHGLLRTCTIVLVYWSSLSVAYGDVFVVK